MTQEKGARYLSGSTKKIQEELEQQQNRNRNSEEGLQGDEEENRGLGVSSRSSVLSHAHMAQTDGELTRQPQAVCICSIHNTLTVLQEAPRLVPEVRQRPKPEVMLGSASDPN